VTAAPITTQPAAPPHDAAVLDAAVLDAIAWTLAVSPDWSAEKLAVIADLIGTVRPHPGELDPRRRLAGAEQHTSQRRSTVVEDQSFIIVAAATGRRVRGRSLRRCGADAR